MQTPLELDVSILSCDVNYSSLDRDLLSNQDQIKSPILSRQNTPLDGVRMSDDISNSTRLASPIDVRMTGTFSSDLHM